jgi:hypothetical protein
VFTATGLPASQDYERPITKFLLRKHDSCIVGLWTRRAAQAAPDALRRRSFPRPISARWSRGTATATVAGGARSARCASVEPRFWHQGQGALPIRASMSSHGCTCRPNTGRTSTRCSSGRCSLFSSECSLSSSCLRSPRSHRTARGPTTPPLSQLPAPLRHTRTRAATRRKEDDAYCNEASGAATRPTPVTTNRQLQSKDTAAGAGVSESFGSSPSSPPPACHRVQNDADRESRNASCRDVVVPPVAAVAACACPRSSGRAHRRPAPEAAPTPRTAQTTSKDHGRRPAGSPVVSGAGAPPEEEICRRRGARPGHLPGRPWSRAGLVNGQTATAVSTCGGACRDVTRRVRCYSCVASSSWGTLASTRVAMIPGWSWKSCRKPVSPASSKRKSSSWAMFAVTR